MTTSESKGRFFYKTNLFESIHITNRIDSNRELECSSVYAFCFQTTPIRLPAGLSKWNDITRGLAHQPRTNNSTINQLEH